MRSIIIAALVAVACSGSNKDPDQPEPADPPPETTETPEQKLYKSQLSACSAVCERLTDCAVADARQNLSKEKVAELDLGNTAPEHTRRCQESCGQKTLSPRQIVVMRECVNGPTECPAYLDCLDRARPGQS